MLINLRQGGKMGKVTPEIFKENKIAIVKYCLK